MTKVKDNEPGVNTIVSRPAMSDTIYLPGAIDYDLYIKKFQATTFDFCGKIGRNIQERVELRKPDEMNCLVAAVIYGFSFKSEHGELFVDTEILFYLPFTNNPNPRYLVNFSIEGCKIINRIINKITQGFENNSVLTIKVQDFQRTRMKWAEAAFTFINSQY